jgi:tRNA-binding protein
VIDAAAFGVVDIRTGTVVSARRFPEARRASYQLVVDFGPELGRKNSIAQLTEVYASERLAGMQVVAVVNLGTKRIAGFSSEVLILGVPDSAGRVVLLTTERPVEDGVRVF